MITLYNIYRASTRIHGFDILNLGPMTLNVPLNMPGPLRQYWDQTILLPRVDVIPE